MKYKITLDFHNNLSSPLKDNDIEETIQRVLALIRNEQYLGEDNNFTITQELVLFLFLNSLAQEVVEVRKAISFHYVDPSGHSYEISKSDISLPSSPLLPGLISTLLSTLSL